MSSSESGIYKKVLRSKTGSLELSSLAKISNFDTASKVVMFLGVESCAVLRSLKNCSPKPLLNSSGVQSPRSSIGHFLRSVYTLRKVAVKLKSVLAVDPPGTGILRVTALATLVYNGFEVVKDTKEKDGEEVFGIETTKVNRQCCMGRCRSNGNHWANERWHRRLMKMETGIERLN